LAGRVEKTDQPALAAQPLEARRIFNRRHGGGEYGNRKAQALLDRHSNASRNLIQRRNYPFTGELGDCSLALLLKATEIPRQRIDLPEVVEPRTTNPMFGDGLEKIAARLIVTVHGLDEADGSGLNQIVQFDLRTPPMKAARQEFILRQMIED